MKTYFVLFLIAAFASATITPLLRRLCERLGLVAGPRSDRHVHQTPIPRLGGVGIFLSVLVALSSLLLVRNLLTQTLRADLKSIGVFLLCSLLVVAVGAYDDIRACWARPGSDYFLCFWRKDRGTVHPVRRPNCAASVCRIRADSGLGNRHRKRV